MSKAHKLVVVTPWYPSEQQPYKAAFVREWTGSLGLDPSEVVTIHLDNVAPGESEEITDSTDQVGRVLRIPVAAPANTPRDEMAEIFRDQILSHAAPILASAQAVHAHVALPSGWGVLAALPDAVPLTYVEHASYLPTLLRTGATRKQIAELVERAQVVLTPGAREAQFLRNSFPAQREKIQSVGNPLNFSKLPLPAEQVTSLNRWLTLSNLVPLKRVDEAIRTFALWHGKSPAARLTVAGAGTELESLAELAGSLGVADAVDFRGAVAREGIADLLQSHDLMLHLSSRETFAIAPLEAVSAGLALVITECGGPEETLFLARETDQVRFVAVDAQGPEVLAAVNVLAGKLPIRSGASNRAELEYRYDVTNFGDRLTKTLEGHLPLGEPSGAGGQFAVFATEATDQQQMIDLFQSLMSREAHCTLVVANAMQYRSLDGRIRLVELTPSAVQRSLVSVRVWGVTSVPFGLLQVLRLGAAVAARLPSKLGKLGRGVRRKVDQLSSGLRIRARSRRRELQAAALSKMLSNSGSEGKRARAHLGEQLSADTRVVLVSPAAATEYQNFAKAGLSHPGIRLEDLPRSTSNSAADAG